MLIPFPSNQAVLDSLADDFGVRDDDIFVISYPKAGTSWMTQLVHLLINRGNQGKVLLIDAVPYLEGLGSGREHIHNRIFSPNDLLDGFLN